MRIVHYLNQFFTGVGGEDAADAPPTVHDGPVGPGRLLDQLLGDEHEIVATVACGDDRAAAREEVIDELLGMVREADPDVLVAGPAFESGRYGLACARLAAAAAADDLLALAAMHPDNPGIAESGAAPVVRSGSGAREMKPSLETLAAAARRLLAGETLTLQDGLVGPAARTARLADRRAAARGVDLVLARLAGDREATEIPLAGFGAVTPAGPVDPAQSTVALLTEGALVPAGNPDRLESARATRWVRYSLQGLKKLASGEYESIHGGFSTAIANADPHRMLPLDVARELEEEGRIGALHTEYFATAGNGTAVTNAQRFGAEWARELRNAGVQAAILTST